MRYKSADKLFSHVESGDKSDKYGDNSENVAIKSGDNSKSGDKKQNVKTIAHKAAIIQYITDHAYATSAELVELLGIKVSRVKVILAELIADNIVITQGANKNRIYKLKR